MNDTTNKRLLDFLKSSIDPHGELHFLAIAAVEIQRWDTVNAVLYQVRAAVTFQEQGIVDPYFDGTDLYVTITPTEITLANEGDWADGPPTMEGSPNELALPWVSELAQPFFVSSEAQKAANLTKLNNHEMKSDVEPGQFF